MPGVRRSDLARLFTTALFRPLIVLRFGGSADREETIKHELVHFFSEKVAPIQPLWFAEGHLRERKITEGQLVAAENADTFASEDAAVTLKPTIVKPLPKTGKTAKAGE